jgi:phosphoribosyl 1,2-cyclic phosphodiesterase
MARLCSLFSGSSGNSVLISGGGAKILVDAGKNARTIENALKRIGEDLRCIDAILVTHEHCDHTTALDVLVRRYRIPVYANAATLKALRSTLGVIDEDLLRVLPTGGTATVKDLSFTSFAVPHDSAECVGYALEAEGSRMAVFTDVGHVPDALLARVAGSDLVFLEANHDVQLLRAGSYPWPLKQRILGPNGHLSNEDCGAAVRFLLDNGTQRFVVGHLSHENNFPELAYQTVVSVLDACGAKVGIDFDLSVAPRSEPGEIHEL